MDTVATVIASVGTVWMVQQTTLQTFLYNFDTYQTNGGDCATTDTATTRIHQRTYVFNKSASYAVNEIGYSPNNGSTICGRLVLPSTDNIGSTNIYIVIIAITYTYSPATPSAVGNVGSGFNTAGDAMIEYWNTNTVNSDGSTNTTNAALDSGNNFLVFAVATYSQNGTIQSVAPSVWSGALFTVSASWTNYSSNRGEMRLTYSTGSVSVSGTTVYGIGFNPSGAIRPPFDIKLTTPVTLTNGTFAPSCTIALVYSRSLNN